MMRDDKTIEAGPELLWQTDAYALLRLVRFHLQLEAPTPRAREDLRRAVGESCEAYERLMRARGAGGHAIAGAATTGAGQAGVPASLGAETN